MKKETAKAFLYSVHCTPNTNLFFGPVETYAAIHPKFCYPCCSMCYFVTFCGHLLTFRMFFWPPQSYFFVVSFHKHSVHDQKIDIAFLLSRTRLLIVEFIFYSKIKKIFWNRILCSLIWKLAHFSFLFQENTLMYNLIQANIKFNVKLESLILILKTTTLFSSISGKDQLVHMVYNSSIWEIVWHNWSWHDYALNRKRISTWCPPAWCKNCRYKCFRNQQIKNGTTLTQCCRIQSSHTIIKKE